MSASMILLGCRALFYLLKGAKNVRKYCSKNMIITNDVKKRFYKYIDMDMQWIGSRSGNGYGTINVGGRRGRNELAHRVSYEIHNGLIPDGACVLHSCDIPLCCNPEHLHLGTMADNTTEMVSRGRGLIGEMNGQSKLTEVQVIDIREKYKDGSRQHDLAEEYGVKQQSISNIVNLKRWIHI